VASHPLALNLDVDVVRGLLGQWADQPTEAGLLARRMALDMARTALGAGRDVIVPQFLGRPEFVTELEQLASELGARFVEIALTATKDEMRSWFASRSATSDTATHADAQLLVDRLGGPAALDRMYDDFAQLIASRPGTRTIPARGGEVDSTLRQLEGVLADTGSEYCGQ
jgi:predicted kinase